MKKDYLDCNLDSISHLKEKTIIMGASYAFSSINSLISVLVFHRERLLIGLSVILVIVTILSVTDNRKQNRDTVAVICSVVVFLAINCFFVFPFSCLWIVVLLSEITFVCLAVWIISKHKAYKR